MIKIIVGRSLTDILIAGAPAPKAEEIFGCCMCNEAVALTESTAVSVRLHPSPVVCVKCAMQIAKPGTEIRLQPGAKESIARSEHARQTFAELERKCAGDAKS